MKISYSLRLIVYHSLWSIESGLMVGENDKMDSLFSGSRICRAIWLQRICAASLSTQLQIETTFTVSHRYYWKNMWIKTLSTIQAIRLKEDIFRDSHPVCLSHDHWLHSGPSSSVDDHGSSRNISWHVIEKVQYWRHIPAKQTLCPVK